MPAPTDSLPMTNAYFLLVLREFGTTPERRAAILAGIDARSTVAGGEITLGDQFRQVRNVNRLEPLGWGLRIGSRFDAAVHGPIGFASVSAPTLGESIAVIARYGHVRSPFYRIETVPCDETFVLRIAETVDLSEDVRLPLLESLLLSIQSLVESVYAAPMRQAEVRLAMSPPAHAERYEEAFHSPVRFDAKHTEVALPARWLAIPSPMADPVAYAEAMRKLEALAARLEGDAFVVARVEQLLRARPDGEVPMEEVARALGMSGRTLARKMQDAGTSYREVIENHLRERAVALLADSRLTIAEVGYQLGYEDPANFGRAFRRWFSVSPGQFRKERAGGDAE